MAVAIEQSATAFYTALSKKFIKHNSLFKQLAKDEMQHVKHFNDLLSRLDVLTYSTEETRKLADYNIQILEKMRVLNNLRKGAERASEVKDVNSAIKTSIQLEKDTLLFYHNLASKFKDEERKQLNKIIRIEHSHLYKIQNITV
jgi:rubrerythrin